MLKMNAENGLRSVYTNVLKNYQNQADLHTKQDGECLWSHQKAVTFITENDASKHLAQCLKKTLLGM